jgi:hypothetical protein
MQRGADASCQWARMSRMKATELEEAQSRMRLEHQTLSKDAVAMTPITSDLMTVKEAAA